MTRLNTIFIDFPNGTCEAIAQTYEDLSRCIAYADNLKNSIGLDNVQVSVWQGVKCYHSTDITVQLDF